MDQPDTYQSLNLNWLGSLSDRLRIGATRQALYPGPVRWACFRCHYREVYPCGVTPAQLGRISISFTSISAGCSIAKAMAGAIPSGGIANLSRDSASWAFTSGLVTPSAKSGRNWAK